jgi:hypothetical protein
VGVEKLTTIEREGHPTIDVETSHLAANALITTHSLYILITSTRAATGLANGSGLQTVRLLELNPCLICRP